MFHCKNGLFFNLLDGKIRIIKTDNGKLPQDGGSLIFEELIDPASWDSVVSYIADMRLKA